MLAFLFGCRHKNMTFPQTPSKGQAPRVTCLDCAQTFEYDWDNMKVIKNKRTKDNGEEATRRYA